MAARVQFQIGPVDATVARAWLANSQRIVSAVRANARELPIEVRDEFLDLIDALLDVWAIHAAKGTIFDWSIETDTDQVLYLVRQWVAIGSLTDEQLAGIGCTWAPDWTRPFYLALEAGAVEVLAQAGPEGSAWAARLTSDD